MNVFSKDQLETLRRYHRYRFFEEVGWMVILVFFIAYAYLMFVSFDPIPFSAILPIALGALVYAVYQFFGSMVLIRRIHETGIHTGDAFVGEKIRAFTVFSPIVFAVGLLVFFVIGGVFGGAVLLASGVVASSLSRLTMLSGRTRLIDRLEHENPTKKVRHLDDVLKQ